MNVKAEHNTFSERDAPSGPPARQPSCGKWHERGTPDMHDMTIFQRMFSTYQRLDAVRYLPSALHQHNILLRPQDN